jgi:anti-sigma B factor antagonist
MQWHTEHRSDYTFARPQVTRLDAAVAPALRGATVDLANQGHFRVVLDMGGVEFVDSSGLGALIHMHKTLQLQGRLTLCNVDPKVAQLFKVTRLERVFSIAESPDDAATLVRA